MTKPPTLHEAEKRGLYAANGTGMAYRDHIDGALA